MTKDKLCEFDDCNERVNFGLVVDNKVKATRCKEHKTEDMKNIQYMVCSVEGCIKAARRGQGFDKCVSHGGCLICSEPDCKSAIADKKSGKCLSHGGSHRCAEPDCKSAAADKTSMKCKSHGGSHRCTEPDCKSSANKKLGKCVKHGGSHRCTEPDCKSSANKKLGKCKKHHGGKRCDQPNCNTGAYGKSNKCVKHGGGDCTEPGCGKASQGKTDKCISHHGGLRCPNCIDWIDSQSANKKYKGYCTRCFQQVFPKDPLSFKIRCKTKEIAVRDFINTLYDGFEHDKSLFVQGCDCTSRRRVDHRKLIGNTMLAIETDEYQHRSYNKDDEEIRYDDLYMIHSGKWIFLRFNPDSYTINGVRKNPKIETRMRVLGDMIETQIKRIEDDDNEDMVEIHKLYYTQ